jgi:hypothetical protein
MIIFHRYCKHSQHLLKGAKQAAEKNDRNQRNQRADYGRYQYVEIARFMSCAAYCEQRDDRAVVEEGCRACLRRSQ